jgi:hypothetical protein
VATPDNETLRAQSKRAEELMAPYNKIVELLDPAGAPDQWTREALAIQALAVLQHRCPACSGEHVHAGDRTIINHDSTWPGHDINFRAYVQEHGINLDKLDRLVYGIGDDGEFHPLFIVGD